MIEDANNLPDTVDSVAKVVKAATGVAETTGVTGLLRSIIANKALKGDAKTDAKVALLDAEVQNTIALERADTAIAVAQKLGAVGPDAMHIFELLVAHDAQAFQNIDRTLGFAADDLADKQEELQEPDSRWMHNWLDEVKAVSDEEAQRLWAAALARETTLNGSVSLMALQVLKVMDKKACEDFRKFVALSMQPVDTNNLYVLTLESGFSKLEGYMTLSELIGLESLALVANHGVTGSLTWRIGQVIQDLKVGGGENVNLGVQHQGKTWAIIPTQPTTISPGLKLPILNATEVGAQIAHLVADIPPNPEYTTAAISYLAEQGLTMRLFQQG